MSYQILSHFWKPPCVAHVDFHAALSSPGPAEWIHRYQIWSISEANPKAMENLCNLCTINTKPLWRRGEIRWRLWVSAVGAIQLFAFIIGHLTIQISGRIIQTTCCCGCWMQLSCPCLEASVRLMNTFTHTRELLSAAQFNSWSSRSRACWLQQNSLSRGREWSSFHLAFLHFLFSPVLRVATSVESEVSTHDWHASNSACVLNVCGCRCVSEDVLSEISCCNTEPVTSFLCDAALSLSLSLCACVCVSRWRYTESCRRATLGSSLHCVWMFRYFYATFKGKKKNWLVHPLVV